MNANIQMTLDAFLAPTRAVPQMPALRRKDLNKKRQAELRTLTTERGLDPTRLTVKQLKDQLLGLPVTRKPAPLSSLKIGELRTRAQAQGFDTTRLTKKQLMDQLQGKPVTAKPKPLLSLRLPELRQRAQAQRLPGADPTCHPPSRDSHPHPER